MKKNYFQVILFCCAMCSCHNNSSNSPGISDSVSVKQTNLVDTVNKLSLLSDSQVKSMLAFNGPINWDDFKSDSLEFDALRKRNPDVKNAKTIAVRYNLDTLASYLNFLKGLGYKDVDVFIGKYPNQDRQPSGTPIPTMNKGKITIMFAGKGMSKETTPFVPAFNVGSPWP